MGAKVARLGADKRSMRQDVWIPLLLVMAWSTVARSVLVYARKLPPPCLRCWRLFERRYLGETVCSCAH